MVDEVIEPGVNHDLVLDDRGPLTNRDHQVQSHWNRQQEMKSAILVDEVVDQGITNNLVPGDRCPLTTHGHHWNQRDSVEVPKDGGTGARRQPRTLVAGEEPQGRTIGVDVEIEPKGNDVDQDSGLSENGEVGTDPGPPVRETIIWVDVEIEHEGDNADQDSGFHGTVPAMGMMELDAEIEYERVKVDQDSELNDIAAEMEIMELDVEIEYEGANVDQDSDLSELPAEIK